MNRERLHSISHVLFLTLVAVLPLHTVFFRVEIAWKPWLILLVVVASLDLLASEGFPWSRRVSTGLAIFLASVLVSWPGLPLTSVFWRLWLALLAGALLLLVTARHGRQLDAVLRVVFWSGAAMGVTAFFVSLATNGSFGVEAVAALNDVPFVERINKPAYLSSGFIAVTNWHQDPGYAALWANVWLLLSVVAWRRGVVRAPAWVGPVVIGSLAAATVLTYSRTGWIGLLAAVAVLVLVAQKEGRRSLRATAKLLWAGALVAVALIAIQILLDPRDVGGDILVALGFRLDYLGELGFIDLGTEGVVDPGLVVADNRLDVWREYWSLFLDSPVRGIGLGTGWGRAGLQEPHNMWLQILAETGLVGLTGFGALLASLGRGGGRVAAAGLVVVALAAMSQTVLFEPVLWFCLGLWVAGTLGEDETGGSQRA